MTEPDVAVHVVPTVGSDPTCVQASSSTALRCESRCQTAAGRTRPRDPHGVPSALAAPWHSSRGDTAASGNGPSHICAYSSATRGHTVPSQSPIEVTASACGGITKSCAMTRPERPCRPRGVGETQRYLATHPSADARWSIQTRERRVVWRQRVVVPRRRGGTGSRIRSRASPRRTSCGALQKYPVVFRTTQRQTEPGQRLRRAIAFGPCTAVGFLKGIVGDVGRGIQKFHRGEDTCGGRSASDSARTQMRGNLATAWPSSNTASFNASRSFRKLVTTDFG